MLRNSNQSQYLPKWDLQWILPHFDCMFNYLKMNKDQQTSELDNESNESDFSDEFLKVDYKDYYFSNVIARSSKTMLECNNAKIDLKKTGTEG